MNNLHINDFEIFTTLGTEYFCLKFLIKKELEPLEG